VHFERRFRGRFQFGHSGVYFAARQTRFGWHMFHNFGARRISPRVRGRTARLYRAIQPIDGIEFHPRFWGARNLESKLVPENEIRAHDPGEFDKKSRFFRRKSHFGRKSRVFQTGIFDFWAEPKPVLARNSAQICSEVLIFLVWIVGRRARELTSWVLPTPDLTRVGREGLQVILSSFCSWIVGLLVGVAACGLLIRAFMGRTLCKATRPRCRAATRGTAQFYVGSEANRWSDASNGHNGGDAVFHCNSHGFYWLDRDVLPAGSPN